LQSFAGREWTELDRETRLAILACETAFNQLQKEARKEAEDKAKKESKQAKRPAKRRNAFQEIAEEQMREAALRKGLAANGATPEAIERFLRAGNDPER